jgi:uncharacterized protein
MRILGFSDLHSSQTLLQRIVDWARANPPDVLICCGDLTNFGTYDQASRLLSLLKTCNLPLLTIHGNCDGDEVVRAMQDQSVYLHNHRFAFADISVVGFGDVTPTPSTTFHEVTDALIGDRLQTLLQPGDILISHMPVYGCNDRVPSGAHVGSHKLLQIIQDIRPRLMLHGHVHEDPGLVA